MDLMATKSKAKKPPSNAVQLKSPVSGRPGGNQQGDDLKGGWWRVEGDGVANKAQRGAALWMTAQILDEHHNARRTMDSVYIGMYENRPPTWLGNMASAGGIFAASELVKTRPALNVVRQVIETAASQLAKNPTEVRAQTSGGTWREQKRAKNLTKFLAGAFDGMDYQRHKQRAFVDGCRSSAGGWVKFWADKRIGAVRCERVNPRCMVWNPLEGDSPKNLYEVRAWPREQLIALCPEEAETIRNARASVNPVNPGAYRSATAMGLAEYADLVDVVEAWHLGTGKGHPGRHMIVLVDGTVLVDEEWEHPWFPFARFGWDDEDDGYGFLALADGLVGHQVRLSKWMGKLLKSFDRHATPAVWKEEGSDVDGDQHYNDAGTVGTFRGTAPTFAPSNSVAPDFYQFGWKIKEEAFAEAGFSVMAVQGQKPSGVDSGEALVAFNDITSTRHVLKGQRLERMDQTAGRITIGLSKDIYKGRKDIRVLAPGTRFLEEIKWDDVDMEEERYTLRCFVTSALPTHVVGRIDAVTKIVKSGLMPEADVAGGQALRLLDFPDLEKYQTLETANRELAEMQVDEALYEGKYIGPEPAQDLELLKTLAQKSLVLAYTLKDVPDRNLEYLNRLMVEADKVLARRQKAQAAPALPVGGGAQPQDLGGAALPGMAGPGGPMVDPALMAAAAAGGAVQVPPVVAAPPPGVMV